jgi:PIN domain nuclease of toxin-antitoxin system
MDRQPQPTILDTAVWLRLMEGDPGLSDQIVDAIEHSASMGTLYVATLSLWEIAMLEAIGRVRFTVPVDTWLAEAIETPGLNLLEVDVRIAAESARLPGPFDGDAIDRMLIGAARTRGGCLYTSDPAIIAYGRLGYADVREVP